MNKSLLVIISVAVLIVVVFMGLFLWKNGVIKTEIDLSNHYDSQFNVVETSFDTMRNTIMNIMNCTREHANKVAQIVALQKEGREGGSLFKLTKESEALGMGLWSNCFNFSNYGWSICCY